MKTELERTIELVQELHSYCSDRPFSNVGPMQHQYQYRKIFCPAAGGPIYSFNCVGFDFKLVEEGSLFEFRLARWPDKGRAPQVWHASGAVWIPNCVAPALYMVKYRAFIEALDRAASIGFSVSVKDEAGYWEGRQCQTLLECIVRDRKHPDPRETVS